jgi:soluble lytic murein transglycosylase-like protein
MRAAVLVLLAWSAFAQSAGPTAREAMRAALEKQQSAAARQRESIRKQAENFGLLLPPGGDIHANASSDADPPRAEFPCDPVADTAVSPLIDTAAKTQNVEPKLLRAVIEQESGFHPCAVSPKGAKGLMQLMPDTAGQFGVTDPLDITQNIQAGARYLKQLLDRYKGDLPQALGAYNAGPTAVDQAGGIPNIPETREYVKSIMKKLAPVEPPP